MTTSVNQFRLDPDHRDEAFLRGSVHHTMSSLGTDTVTPLPRLNTAAGTLPPTNRWFSALAFDEPGAVFAMPYSYRQTGQGFTFGLPKVVTSRHAVTGAALSDIAVEVGAQSFRISRHDLVSVTVEFLNEIGRTLGQVVLAQGVPYLSYTAVVPHDVTFSVPFTMAHENLATYAIQGRAYGMVTTGTYSARALSLKVGEFFTLIALPTIPKEATPAQRSQTYGKLAHAAQFPVQSTEVTAGVGPDQMTTTIRYLAKDNGPVCVVRMAHHGPSAEPSLGTYATVAGTVTLHSEKTFTWRTRAVEPAGELDLSRISDLDRARLVDLIRADMAVEPRAPIDTYFAGKALLRDVNLVMMGQQLGVPGTAEFRAGVEARFLTWLDPDGVNRQDDRFFVYEPQWRGVVGIQASFGADEFNDHHLQSGYFLYAGALLARDNLQLRERAQLVLDAIAWDVCAPIQNPWVPLLRVFDPYRGHSWASGIARGDYGNKQETIAEAVNCWNGIALWSAVTGNQDFEVVARWLLALEIQSSLDYWTDPDLADPVFAEYQHPVIPQVWGGKHEYATWFNAEPAAMLGSLIQPLSAVSDYLTRNPERMGRSIDEAVGYFRDFEVLYGDYLLMYWALKDSQSALAAQAIGWEFPADQVEDGNSKSYLMAWILTR